jgi:hypothetical protein
VKFQKSLGCSNCFIVVGALDDAAGAQIGFFVVHHMRYPGIPNFNYSRERPSASPSGVRGVQQLHGEMTRTRRFSA